MISYEDFANVDIRVGKIINVEAFQGAKKPAYKLTIDFGATLGLKKSSAQLTKYYTPQQLLSKQVLCVINFAPKQIGHFMSEVLTLGVPDEEGQCILIEPDIIAPLGGKLF